MNIFVIKDVYPVIAKTRLENQLKTYQVILIHQKD